MKVSRLPIPGPYKGLIPYSEEDALFFFGRDRDRRIITANLLGSRLTLLYGATGVGKSSVLRAGVVHHLRRLARRHREIKRPPELAVAIFDAWHTDPLPGLLEKVQEAVIESLGKPEILPESGGDFCAALHWWTKQINGDLLVILDQFEEYLLHEKQGDSIFASEFVRAVNKLHLRVNFLISIREDALASLDRFEGKVPTLFENYLRLDRMDLKGAREAIIKPVEAWCHANPRDPRVVNHQLVEEVLTGILNHARRATPFSQTESEERQRIDLPPLQIVMTRLWEEEIRSGSSQMMIETLHKLGGVDAILKGFLDDRLRDLKRREVQVAGRLFRHLVTAGEMRVALTARDLAAQAQVRQARIEPVLKKLKEKRLLTEISREPGEVRYEVPYDSLARVILDWREEFDQRRAGRIRAGWAVLTLVFALLSAVALIMMQQVDQEKRLASAERLAATALYYSDRRLDLALLLAAEGSRNRDSGKVRSGLLSTLQEAPRLQSFLHVDDSGVSSLAFRSDGLLAVGTGDGEVQLWGLESRQPKEPPLAKHVGRVSAVAFSPDGSTLASAGEDGAVYLWELRRRRPVPLVEPSRHLLPDRFTSVAYGPGGNYLAVGSSTRRVDLWNLDSPGHKPMRLQVSGLAVSDGGPMVAFSPDGRFLAAAGPDGAVRLWSSNGKPLATLQGDSGNVVSLGIDPSSRLLAAGTRTGKVLLWRLRRRQLVGAPVTAHVGRVWSIAFSPDGSRLATAGADRRVRLWNAQDLRPEGDLTGGHTTDVRSIAFRGDGKMLASGDADGRVCLWTLEEGPALGQRLGLAARGVESVAFSPDGQFLASGGLDRQVRLWDPEQRSIAARALAAGVIWSVAFSPRDPVVAWGELTKESEEKGRGTASKEEIGRVRLWNFRQGSTSLLTSETEGHGVEGLAFSPSGKILASADRDGTIRLWEIDRQDRAVFELSAHTHGVWGVAFSPDGKNLASCGQDQTIRLWDVDRRVQIGALTGHKKEVAALAYAPDGKVLASGGLDGQVLLWDLQRRRLIGPLMGRHAGGVSEVAFSPDGKLVASCGRDRHIRLWSPLTREPVGDPFEGHIGEVTSIDFQPDGRRLASGDSEGGLYLWDVDFNSWRSRACAKANRNLSLDEWRQFVDPEAPYEKTCPTLPSGEGVSQKGPVSPDKE